MAEKRVKLKKSMGAGSIWAVALEIGRAHV